MNNIDILEDKEELENFLKRLGYIEEGYLTNGHMTVGNINDINKAIKLVKTLIAENKELKEENEIWKSIFYMGNSRPYKKKYIELLQELSDERNNTDEH